MIRFLKTNKKEISIGLAIWFFVGFLIGAFSSCIERYAYRPEDRRSGCVYKSIAAFTNVGYVLGCETFRERFEMEGLKP